MYEIPKVSVVLSEWVKDFGSGQTTGVSVPCGDCHACCQSLRPQLYEEELNLGFQKKFNKKLRKWELRHRPNGECVYLNEKGCSIHDRVPKVCRAYDCRYMGFFKIRNPIHEYLNAVSRKWVFIIDRPDIEEYLKNAFALGVNLMPVKSGEQVDRLAVRTLFSAYKKFFEVKDDA